MRIAVYGEKGGCGKTTAAVPLAVLLGLPYRDLDPQGTGTRWLERRDPPHPLASDQDDAWLADCSPGISAALIPLLDAADMIVIPVRASFNDLVTLPSTVDFVRRHARHAGFVAADIDTRTSDRETVLDVLRGYDLPVLGVLTHRVAYRRAGLAGQMPGELDPVAAAEIAAVAGAITKEIAR